MGIPTVGQRFLGRIRGDVHVNEFRRVAKTLVEHPVDVLLGNVFEHIGGNNPIEGGIRTFRVFFDAGVVKTNRVDIPIFLHAGNRAAVGKLKIGFLIAHSLAAAVIEHRL